jgi:hypothetical protein
LFPSWAKAAPAETNPVAAKSTTKILRTIFCTPLIASILLAAVLLLCYRLSGTDNLVPPQVIQHRDSPWEKLPMIGANICPITLLFNRYFCAEAAMALIFGIWCHI